MKLGSPSKYQGQIRGKTFDRIIEKHRSHYRSQMTEHIAIALREYLVEGKPAAKTSYDGTRQAFRSRLIYYIAAWEKTGNLSEKDFK